MACLVWSGLEPWHTEMALVDLEGGGLRASGVQLRTEPWPFRLDYRVEAPGHVTSEVELICLGDGVHRYAVVRHDGAGGWSITRDGKAQELPELEGALDCDILASPLTNTMPVLRHGLATGGSADLVVAFIEVPELTVSVSHQRYEHLRATPDGSVVRYTNTDSGFTVELELDQEGFVVEYPGLAARVS